MHQSPNPSIPRNRDSASSSAHSKSSGKSYNSNDTAPTEYSSSARPPVNHYKTCGGRIERHFDAPFSRDAYQTHQVEDPRSSTETYASTLYSEDDQVEEEEEGSVDDFEHMIPQARPLQSYPPEALPATPADFGQLFPSTRQLTIKHDDSTDDGNMNLRLDTAVQIPGGKLQDITLFHLRMHDLKKRQFSLRRYCRDSGREVCHTVRKYQESTQGRRPSLSRSIGSAFAALRSKSESKTTTTASNLQRSDSGYGSILSRKSVEDDQQLHSASSATGKKHAPIPTNTIKIEFSNYSQVEVRRRGTRNNKHYNFEYWGTEYNWKRVVDRTRDSERVMYHLHRAGEVRVLASVEPHILEASQMDEEVYKGGWIPPCSMQINDRGILKDRNEISDVIVASGLIALVDDCIKYFFDPKPHHELVIPVPRLRIDVDYVGTRTLLKDMLHGSNKHGTSSKHRPTTLRRNVSHDR